MVPVALGLTALLSACAGAAAALWVFRRRSAGGGSGEPTSPPLQGPEREVLDGHRAPDWSALSSQFLGFVRQIMDAKGVVFMESGETGWKVAMSNPGLAIKPFAGNRESLFSLAKESEEPVAARSVDPAALGYLAKQRDPVSVALLPSRHRGEVRGLLVCHREEKKPFDEKEMAVLGRCEKILTGWLLSAAHAKAVMVQKDRDERLARGLETLASERDPEEIAGLALDALFDLLPALFGYVVIQSARFGCAHLVTKAFGAPETFTALKKDTWTHWVMTKGNKPFMVDGAASRDTAMPFLYDGEPFPKGASAYLHPMASPEEVFGLVGIVAPGDALLREEDILAADRFIRQVGALVTLALLDRQNRERAVKDGLTDLYNRRFFQEQLSRELSRSLREGKPVSLILSDIDHFKAINDTFGHPAGDLALRAVANRMKSCLREEDVLCRYGGEEFAALLPGCSLRVAESTAERIREAVQEATKDPKTCPAPLTISVGIAAFPKPSGSASALVQAADAALYEAKQGGRNRVVKAR